MRRAQRVERRRVRVVGGRTGQHQVTTSAQHASTHPCNHPPPMTDVFSPAERSRVMSRIRGRDTKPELQIRSMLHRLGYRFRLHRRDLPGSPDIVLPKHRTVIFVHGCFWHRHPGCRYSTTPATRARFWRLKFERNVERDGESTRSLRRAGWRVITIWECEVRKLARHPERIGRRLHRALGVAD